MVRVMHAPARSLLVFATLLIGCGGEMTISGNRGPIGASGGGTDSGTASGGRSGLPSLSRFSANKVVTMAVSGRSPTTTI
jgi:hypothetical protein